MEFFVINAEKFASTEELNLLLTSWTSIFSIDQCVFELGSSDKIGGPNNPHRKNLDAEKGVKQKQIIRKSGEHAFVLNHLKSNACSPNF